MSDLQLARPVVLVGLPGAGKTRVGRAVAQRLGVRHVDTDDLIVEAAGTSIPQIFETQGEAEFRRMELDAVRRALQEASVVSLGGGALETPAVQEALKDVTVVYIEAEHDVLLRRVTRNSRRPLLRENPEEKLKELSARRIPIYEAAADVRVQTSEGPIGRVVDQLMAALEGPAKITVRAKPDYPVWVGSGIVSKILSTAELPGENVLVLCAPHVDVSEVELALQQRGKSTTVRVVPDGESAKTLETAAQLWDDAGKLGIGRSDLIVTVGGGATTDLGGFIAATWLRGIAVVHIPSTVLGMVDAAIGGKTGINAAAGKNLIGAFHNPIVVLADLEWLRTLPQAEYTAGMAEVIKCGFIADPQILDIIDQNPRIADQAWGTSEGSAVLKELIERAVRVKASVVAADFKEGGLREVLNYGHTLAHAIEKLSDYQVRHGEAVAIGMMLAANLAELKGLLTAGAVRKHRAVLEAANLPVTYRADIDELTKIMYSDKKTRGGQLRFVLLDDLGSALTVPVSADDVKAAAGGVVR